MINQGPKAKFFVKFQSIFCKAKLLIDRTMLVNYRLQTFKDLWEPPQSEYISVWNFWRKDHVFRLFIMENIFLDIFPMYRGVFNMPGGRCLKFRRWHYFPGRGGSNKWHQVFSCFSRRHFKSSQLIRRARIKLFKKIFLYEYIKLKIVIAVLIIKNIQQSQKCTEM